MQVQSVSFKDVPGSTTDLLRNLGYGCLRSVYLNLTVHPGIDTDASGEEFSHQRKGRKKHPGEDAYTSGANGRVPLIVLVDSLAFIFTPSNRLSPLFRPRPGLGNHFVPL